MQSCFFIIIILCHNCLCPLAVASFQSVAASVSLSACTEYQPAPFDFLPQCMLHPYRVLRILYLGKRIPIFVCPDASLNTSRYDQVVEVTLKMANVTVNSSVFWVVFLTRRTEVSLFSFS